MRNWIENEAKDVPLTSRVICRIYANVRGLGDALVRTGALASIEDFEDFVRGFTRAKTMFDFIDVGAGKDRADEKIIGKCHFPLGERECTDADGRELQDLLTGLSLPQTSVRLLARR